jgi:tripeptide aminopeptidase
VTNALLERKTTNMDTLLLGNLCECYGYDLVDDDILDFIAENLHEMDGVLVEVDDFGNIYAQKGEGPYPCFVSHVDTVHADRPHLTVRVKGDKMYAFGEYGTPLGVGGDDRCGVFIALEMMKKLDNVKAAFFRAEETGGKGSEEADMDFFTDCQFLAENDRTGNTGVVNNIYGTVMTGTDFDTAIAGTMERHGRKLVKGGFTDVMALVDKGLECPAINVECGYYRAHSKNEYISLKDVKNTILFLTDLTATVHGNKFDAPVQPLTSYGYGRFRRGKSSASKYTGQPYAGYSAWGVDPYENELDRYYRAAKESVDIEDVLDDELDSFYCDDKDTWQTMIDCDLCEYRHTCDTRTNQFRSPTYDADVVCTNCGGLSDWHACGEYKCRECETIFFEADSIPF